MRECAVAYIGDNQIATNFYALTETQRAKRSLLNVNEYYDILNLDYIKLITSQCDRVCITQLQKRITGNTYLFNYLLENGTDLSKVITFQGDHSFSMKHKISAIEEDRYKGLFDSELTFSEEELVVSELIIMGMESLHNLYWATGGTANWDQIYTNDNENYKECKEELKKKYNVTNLDGFFSKDANHNYKNEFDIKDYKKMRKLRKYAARGFHVIIKAPAHVQESGHGVFLHYFENNNREYWKLDNSEYYIVMIHGIGYPLRYFEKLGLSYILHLCKIESLEDFKLAENRTRFIQLLYKKFRWFYGKGLDMTGRTNTMLLSLIKPIYDMSGDVHLYNCDSGCIGIAVKKNVKLTDILKKLNEQIKTLELGNCFDSVSVVETSSYNSGIAIHDINNPMRMDLKYLDKIENTESDANGCDEQQVMELFSILRE